MANKYDVCKGCLRLLRYILSMRRSDELPFMYVRLHRCGLEKVKPRQRTTHSQIL